MTTAPQKKPKKQPQPSNCTVAELKAWLAGIEAFQGVDWTPTSEQWDAVKRKIRSLSDAPLGVSNASDIAYSNHNVYQPVVDVQQQAPTNLFPFAQQRALLNSPGMVEPAIPHDTTPPNSLAEVTRAGYVPEFA